MSSTRILNGKPVTFYSPHEIEEMTLRARELRYGERGSMNGGHVLSKDFDNTGIGNTHQRSVKGPNSGGRNH